MGAYINFCELEESELLRSSGNHFLRLRSVLIIAIVLPDSLLFMNMIVLLNLILEYAPIVIRVIQPINRTATQVSNIASGRDTCN